MTQEIDALDFIGEMSQATRVNIAIGVNAYIENPDSASSFDVIIDPSSLNDEDEAKIEQYVEARRLRLVESWNDWGRFLRVTKPRPLIASAISP